LVVASVGNIEKSLFLEFEKEVEVHFISMMTPFVNRYETPQTLGIDRWFLLLAQPCSFLNRLVIDAGTV
jgi:type III pantothenate kinase